MSGLATLIRRLSPTRRSTPPSPPHPFPPGVWWRTSGLRQQQLLEATPSSSSVLAVTATRWPGPWHYWGLKGGADRQGDGRRQRNRGAKQKGGGEGGHLQHVGDPHRGGQFLRDCKHHELLHPCGTTHRPTSVRRASKRGGGRGRAAVHRGSEWGVRGQPPGLESSRPATAAGVEPVAPRLTRPRCSRSRSRDMSPRSSCTPPSARPTAAVVMPPPCPPAAGWWCTASCVTSLAS